MAAAEWPRSCGDHMARGDSGQLQLHLRHPEVGSKPPQRHEKLEQVLSLLRALYGWQYPGIQVGAPASKVILTAFCSGGKLSQRFHLTCGTCA